MLKTRIGRWFLLVVAGVATLIVTNPSFRFLPNGAGDPSRGHRPPVSAHDGETITMTVVWSAKYKPSSIAWAIGRAVQQVDMSRIPDVPPSFSQTLTYNPGERYEIWATVRYPGICSIAIDGTVMDHDQVPKGANEERGVHCWVDPV